MPGWLQRLLRTKVSLSASEESKVTKCSTSSTSASAFSPETAPLKLPQPPSALSSQQRWSRKYDVLVCQSPVDSDIEEAGRLVSFLEAPPCSFRCFFWERDTCPGGAVSTELCEAVRNCHVWALLITPNFLQDDWCKYMTHQALAEGPMSHRTVPLLKNLSRSQVPQELKFFYNIDLNNNPDQGYALLQQTVLLYLQELHKKYEDT